MKKLKTTGLNGFPLKLGKLRWMEDGLNEALFALCRSLLPVGSTSLILEGCVITKVTEGNYTVSAGWVYINFDTAEKICKVDQHSFILANGSLPFPTMGTTARWSDYYDEDPSGSVTNFAGMNININTIQKARVTVDDDPSSPAVALSAKRNSGQWVVGEHLWSRVLNGFLQIKSNPSSNYLASTNLGFLPEEHRLSVEVIIPITGRDEDNGIVFLTHLRIAQNGFMSLADAPLHDSMYFINLSIPM